MKISIVTPSYNQGKFLETTLRSVLEQDYADLEYFVIDGKSSDDSVAIIERYAHRLEKWVSEPDHGQAEAINKGFSWASGEIIAWINSDDYYLKGTFHKVVRLFQDNPEIGLLFGDVISIDENRKVINVHSCGETTLQDLMTFKIINQPAVFMRRSVLEEAGYLDEGYHYLLDHHLWLRIAAISDMKYISQPLAVARYHQDAKNLSAQSGFGKEAYKIVKWLQEWPVTAKKFADNEKKVRAGAYRIDGYYHSIAHQYKESLQKYFRCIFLHPSTALQDWKRIFFTFFALFGFRKLEKSIRHVKTEQLSKYQELVSQYDIFKGIGL
ncbi:MAG: glycosyltransferase [Anaerolineaceae bacterium]|nr:glycosyltransferase [Anaerolineaceae bacterium]